MCNFIYRDFSFFKNNCITVYKTDKQGFTYSTGNYIQ